MQKTYFVYIVASKSRVLYIGVTSHLLQRQWQHANKATKGFTSEYNVYRLVYFEVTTDSLAAIAREKQLKRWRREKKIALIEKDNPTWEDLAAGWAA
jgi:putative endonuclease